jgi:DNA-directed RNA polymerase subunit RPC12/RpoP
MASENKPSLRCPSCGSVTVRRSKRTLLDRLVAYAGYRPYRCHDCRRRYHVVSRDIVAGPKAEARVESRKRRKALKRRELVVYAFALVAFAIAAFVITRERG